MTTLAVTIPGRELAEAMLGLPSMYELVLFYGRAEAARRIAKAMRAEAKPGHEAIAAALDEIAAEGILDPVGILNVPPA